MPNYSQMSDQELLSHIQEPEKKYASMSDQELLSHISEDESGPFKSKLSYDGKNGSTTTVDTLPTTKDVDNLIAERPGLTQIPANFSSVGQGAATILRAAATPFQIAEAVPADLALAAQRANQGGFKDLGENLIKDLSGTRAPQLGDVYRGSGIPGLSSEPVASTLGLVASVGIPGVNAGTNAIGDLYAQGIKEVASSPVLKPIVDASSRFGKQAVVNSLSFATSKPAHIWESFLDHPEWGSKKFVTALRNDAQKAYDINVAPLEKNTANRVVLDDSFKSKLHELGVFVKPQGVDDVTFSKAISGDKDSLAQFLNQKAMDDLERIANAKDLTPAARLKQMEKIGLETPMTSTRGTAFKIKGSSVDELIEPSQALGGMTKTQQTEVIGWYKKLVSKEEMSFNEARHLWRDINSSMESYYNMSAQKGTGVTGAQANSFHHYAQAMKDVLVNQVGSQYPEAGKALKVYADSKVAEGVHRAVSTMEPHMFRSFMTRLGLGLVVPYKAAFVAGSLTTIPKVNNMAIRGASAVGGMIAKHPAAVLSPLLRKAGVNN